MELNQLRYFQKVACVKSVTKAAEELYISQSTLSQCLMRLEESIGCPLFIHQQGRRLQLNESGEVFLHTVDRVLQDLEAGVDQARALSGRGGGKQISMASSVHDLCNTIVLGFFRRNPDVRISQRLVNINSLTGLLLNNEVDLTISPCPLEDFRLDCRKLYTEELLVAVGPDHPLRGKKYVTRQELLQEKYICNFSESDKYFLEIMLFKNHPVNTILESNEPTTIQALVDSGAGIAFVPARVVMRNVMNQSQEPERFLRLSDYHFDAPTCMTRKRKTYLSRAVRDLYDYVVEYCTEESAQVERFLENYY